MLKEEFISLLNKLLDLVALITEKIEKLFDPFFFIFEKFIKIAAWVVIKVIEFAIDLCRSLLDYI